MKRNLLFIVTTASYFLSHRLSLAKAAQKAGFKIFVATSAGDGVDTIKSAGFTHYHLKFNRRGVNPFVEIKTVLSLIRCIAALQPDVIHNVALKPVLYGSLAAWASRSKALVINAVTGLGFLFISQKLLVRVVRSLVEKFMLFCFASPKVTMIFQNKDDLQLFINKNLIASSQGHLIPGSGADTNKFFYQPEVSSPKVVILFPARMLYDKGVGEVVEAAAMLKKRGVSCDVLLAGDPDPENPASLTTQQLQHWQDEGLVTWLGHQQDLVPWYHKAHIVTLPSYREGLPLSLVEAAACGRPIVTTNTAGCNTIVKNGENGLTVPIADPKALADALEKLALDPALRKKMGERGRQMVEQSFSDSVVNQQTLRLYKKVLGI